MSCGRELPKLAVLKTYQKYLLSAGGATISNLESSVESQSSVFVTSLLIFMAQFLCMSIFNDFGHSENIPEAASIIRWLLGRKLESPLDSLTSVSSLRLSFTVHVFSRVAHLQIETRSSFSWYMA
jgi:hypothetical protein